MNGEPLNLQYTQPVVPLRIRAMGVSVYGIEYDFRSRAITDALPAGWGSSRCTSNHFISGLNWSTKTPSLAYLYGQVSRALNSQFFGRTQYSCWRKRCRATHCWSVMFSIMRALPYGFMESTVKGLSMYQLTSALMDVTRKVILGGQFSRTLRGLTPAGLITQGTRQTLEHWRGGPLETAQPHHLIHLPEGVMNTFAANNPQNWRF
ncbi:hypothetical protein SCHPADRAFT_172018 [Schizopora paradoxa]|uniref:Uncharacterized protein n=1 Tax=Schizopora paradoxa TaxID=27342 RepID=A0A0H2SJK2_9AGAM|nr:hypothetical protein SCHPADRAFT_172018 [Schizopora paradoxa]